MSNSLHSGMIPTMPFSSGSAICESALSRLTANRQEKNSSPPGSLAMSDHPSVQSSSSSPDIISTKTPGVSFCSFGNARQSLHGAIPWMSPSVSMPGAIGLPAAWLQYSLYPPPSASGVDPRTLGLAEYHHQLKQTSLPTDLSYLKYKAPLVNRNYLELAMLVCNTFRGKLFPCPHCRYVTDRRNNLKRHISTMHQACDKVLECCGVSFATKASLREHIMIFHHNGYSCPFCGRRFCRKALLRRHLTVHNGQKDYNCPHCDYATSHKSNLERHKRIHERLKINEPATSLLPRNLSIHSSSSDSSSHVTVGTTENCPIECDSESCSQIPDTTVMPGSNSPSFEDLRENNSPIALTTSARDTTIMPGSSSPSFGDPRENNSPIALLTTSARDTTVMPGSRSPSFGDPRENNSPLALLTSSARDRLGLYSVSRDRE